MKIMNTCMEYVNFKTIYRDIKTVYTDSPGGY